MGEAYGELIRSNPNRLRAQMQAYAACDDPDVCAVARKGFGGLVDPVERASGVDADTLSSLLREGDADQRRRLDGPAGREGRRGRRRWSRSAWSD